MRSLVLVAPERLEWRETPDARLMGDGEAIIRPVVIGRCDLDIGYVRGMVSMASGTPIGHEVIGDVIDVGDRVTQFRPGDRVVIPGLR